MAKKIARYWSIEDIQPLPKRLYKKFYGEDYSDSWKLRFSGLSEEEKKALQPILKQQKFKEIYWVPEVDYPLNHKTADLVVDNQWVEIKQVSSINSIRKRIKQISKQVEDSGWAILDTTSSKLSYREQIGQIEQNAAKFGLRRFAISNNGKAIAFKQQNSPERASSKTQDSGLSYTSILPHNVRKVNRKNASSPTFSPRSAEYWAKRSLERTIKAELESKACLQEIQKVYRKSAESTVEDVKAMYQVYYQKDKGFNMVALNSITNHGSIQKFKEEMAKNGLSTYLPDNYKGRMTRLELMNAEMWLEVKKAAAKEQALSFKHYGKTIRDTYSQTVKDILGRTASSNAFSKIDTSTVNKILGTKFYGKNYSERIWSNSDHLAKELQGILARAIATGQSPAKTIREIQTRFNVNNHNAARLVRTETNYFENQAELESYKELGIEKYQILATLDSRTSEICRTMDKKVFLVKDARQGENAPPFHPYCRTTIIPYVSKELEPKQRIARDPATERNYYVQGDMNYEPWHKSLVEGVAHKIDKRVAIAGITKAGLVKTANGINFDAPKLTKIDGDLLRDVATTADNLLNMFPNVKKWVKEQGGLVITGTYRNDGVLASTLRAKPIITLNTKYYGSMKKMLNLIFRKSKQRHFMPTADYKSYTFTHEFGHLVENYLLRDNNTDVAARRIKSAIIEIAMQQSGLTKAQIRKQVSRYALDKDNPREFFAEAFANAFMGKSNVLGKAIKTYLKGELQNGK